jgi:hypothetical protein
MHIPFDVHNCVHGPTELVQEHHALAMSHVKKTDADRSDL